MRPVLARAPSTAGAPPTASSRDAPRAYGTGDLRPHGDFLAGQDAGMTETRVLRGDDPAAVALLAAMEAEVEATLGPVSPERTSVVSAGELRPPGGADVVGVGGGAAGAGGAARRGPRGGAGGQRGDTGAPPPRR